MPKKHPVSLRSTNRNALSLALGVALVIGANVHARDPAGQADARIRPRAEIIAVPQIKHPDGESAQWWFGNGAAAAAANGAYKARSRNVILFIGDGMSIPTIAAARILEGQRQGGSGEEHRLSFEEFPNTALSRTYTTDMQTPDSAGTMSAMMTGAKTRSGVLGVAQKANRGDCSSGKGQSLVTALELAETAGMSTGVVTTTRLTHATPGATYAHSVERDWEYDMAMPPAAKEEGCIDIARQMVEFPYGDGIDVALGGGRGNFRTTDHFDPEYPDQVGLRLDGRDLVDAWQLRHPGGAYVWNAKELAAVDLAKTPALLGLFEPDHMQFDYDRPHDAGGEPSLAQMTTAAMTVLQKNRRGYFLMVEGGRIDHAHHYGNAFRALTDTIAFSDAVRAAASLASSDTLIIVTADHSHTMSFVGYPKRGNPILGKVRGSSGEGYSDDYARDSLGLPYTTLNYATGPGYTGASGREAEGSKHYLLSVSSQHTAGDVEGITRGRPNLTEVDTEDANYLQEATIPTSVETHGGDDVAIFARGPGSEALHGSLEQNVIFHVMVQATPVLREALCKLGDCNRDGIPVTLPEPTSLPRSGIPGSRSR